MLLNGRAPRHGEVIRLPLLANTFKVGKKKGIKMTMNICRNPLLLMLGIAIVKWFIRQNDGHLLQNQRPINMIMNNENTCLFCNKSKLGYDFKFSRCQNRIKDSQENYI